MNTGLHLFVARRFWLGLLFLLVPQAQAVDTPFYQQGTISSPAAPTTFNEDMTGSTFLDETIYPDYAAPTIARDASGKFYVGAGRTLSKYEATGDLVWSTTWSRTSTLVEPTDAPAYMRYEEQWSAVPGHDNPGETTGYSNVDHGMDGVMKDLKIVKILATDDGIFVIATERKDPANSLTGNLRTYVAKFMADGEFKWRVVTDEAYGETGYYITPTFVEALYDSTRKTLYIAENSAGYIQCGSRFTQIQIDGEEATRHGPIFFGFGGSGDSQTWQAYHIRKMLQEADGDLVWLVTTGPTTTSAPHESDMFEDTYVPYATEDRILVFNPDNMEEMDPAHTLISDYAATPDIEIGNPGYIGVTVADVDLDGDNRLYVLSNKRTFDGDYSVSYTFFVDCYALDLENETDIFDPLWTANADAAPLDDYGTELLINNNRMTVVGNASQAYMVEIERFPGWQLTQFTLNEDAAPTYKWRAEPPAPDSNIHLDVYSTIRGADVDGDGNVYFIADYAQGSSFNDAVYAKYSSTGKLQFIQPLSPSGTGLYNNIDGRYTPELFLGASSNLAFMRANGDEKPWTVLTLANPAIIAPATLSITSGASASTFSDSFGQTRVDYVATTSLPVWRFWATGLPGGLSIGNDPTNLGRISGILPDSTPFGSYPVKIYTEGAQGFASKTVTIKHLPPAPYFISQPVGGLIAKNTAKKLTAKASGSGRTYKWQKKVGTTWTNISGATASSYTTPKIITTQYFRVIVTNLGGSATSATVTLKPDTAKPVINMVSPVPPNTLKSTTAIKGMVSDNLKMSTLKYRIKFGTGAYSTSKSLVMGTGDPYRPFSLSLATKTKGVYSIEFTATDTSGNKLVYVFKVTRK